jgi:hypothetical protein
LGAPATGDGLVSGTCCDAVFRGIPLMVDFSGRLRTPGGKALNI